MPISEADALKQIDEALNFYSQQRSRSEYDDLSDLPEGLSVEVATRLQTTIMRLAPMGSSYVSNLDELHKKFPILHYASTYNKTLPGMLRALRADYVAGYLKSIGELIHADIFSDFLEMAGYLLDEGYKDPAAVLAGGALEEHLRKLCEKHTITTTLAGRPKKAESMNAELAGSSAYAKLDQKNVTAWLDLRNKAAHGHYTEYEKQQVHLMIQGIRDFITRIPA